MAADPTWDSSPTSYQYHIASAKNIYSRNECLPRSLRTIHDDITKPEATFRSLTGFWLPSQPTVGHPPAARYQLRTVFWAPQSIFPRIFSLLCTLIWTELPFCARWLESPGYWSFLRSPIALAFKPLSTPLRVYRSHGVCQKPHQADTFYSGSTIPRRSEQWERSIRTQVILLQKTHTAERQFKDFCPARRCITISMSRHNPNNCPHRSASLFAWGTDDARWGSTSYSVSLDLPAYRLRCIDWPWCRKISEQYDKVFVTGCLEPQTNGPRANAALVILARNQELEGVVQSIKSMERHFNRWFHYPYVFLNDGDFNTTFKETILNHTSAPVEFGKIDPTMWGYPDWVNIDTAREGIRKQGDAAIMYGGMESYHHMCRFYSGFVLNLARTFSPRLRTI